MEVACEIPSWDEMIPDLLGLIFMKLSLDERLNVIPSVCKSWNKVIKGPQSWVEIDIKYEWSSCYKYNQIESLIQMLIMRSCGSVKKLSVHHLETEEIFNFIAENRYTYGRGYYIYDPVAKECITMPPFSSRCNESLYAVGFICNPKDAMTASCINERNLRVVIIKSFIIRMEWIELYVFSSDTGLWKHIVLNNVDGFAFAPHWLLSLTYGRNLYFMGRTGIFVFDPYTNYKNTINYPLEVNSMNIMSFGFLGISCGALRIADIEQNDLRVWELNEKNHWDLLHNIHLLKKMPQNFCANYFKRVAGFHPYDGSIVYLHSYADGMFVCNLRTERFAAVAGYEKTDISPFQLKI